MRNNNKKQANQLHSLIVILSLLVSGMQANQTKHSNSIEDLTNFTLHHQQQGYHLLININHHPIKLKAELQNGRTWIKKALCKVCDLQSQQCKSSCFTEKDNLKISCDSSYCSQIAKYSDQSRGIVGIQGSVFLKIGEHAQILMPLILANKLYQNHTQLGIFNIFDTQTSFNNAFISRSPLGSLEVYNINKLSSYQQQKYRQKDGKPLNLTIVGEQFQFESLRVNKVILHHIDNQEKYADFEENDQFQVSFSLQALAMQFPIKLAKKIEKHLNQTYLLGKKCKLFPKKLKCAQQIEAAELFKAIFHFKLKDLEFMIPLHMLITACSKNQCNTLINYEQQSQNKITFGYAIWQLYNLQYNINKKYAIWHRINTQWDDLFLKDKVNISKLNFGYGLFLIFYHTIKYILIALFWIAILSIGINIIMRWRNVLIWIRGLLINRKMNRVIEQQETECIDQKSFRKINKLESPFQEDEQI